MKARPEVTVGNCSKCRQPASIDPCVVCQRQDAANRMLDDVTAVLKALSDRSSDLDIAGDSVSKVNLKRLMYAELAVAIRWSQMTGDLKLHGLKVTVKQQAELHADRGANDARLVEISKLLSATKRQRLQLVDGGK